MSKTISKEIISNNKVVNELLNNIINIEKPARYIGFEPGIPDKDFINSEVKVVISYPDIYEIGMSNNGIKILYDRINKLDFACCERVFSPWVDFEKILLDNNIPLFSLESKRFIKDFDILGISIQYELLFSNFLNILKLSGISIFKNDRCENDPIVILGGPAVSNPMPYYHFADLIYIGEGEDGIVEIVNKIRELKKLGVSRRDKIEALSKIEGIYSPEFTESQVKRRVYMGFSDDEGPDIYIRPNINVVQNKLVVEIMRGCPNRCRFCQAGIIYKPYREKDIDTILRNVDKGLIRSGVDEVTFASLSSGDYSNILELVEIFNETYKSRGISFSLPSLKVETFDINLLEKISEVRKSGLTFAIETPSYDGQKKLGKVVDNEKIEKIISEALKKGWSVIKFYFMVGLPGIENEEVEIVKFIDNLLLKYRKLNINLNLATFVPKPHTPFQFEKQIPLEESIKKINYIKEHYKKSRVMVKEHSPYMSYVEGFIARGDKDVGLAMYDAFLNGAKFDGWNDRFNFEIYKNAFEKNNISFDMINNYSFDNYPWKIVDSLESENFLFKENEKAKMGELTSSCKEYCDKDCKVCRNGIKTINKKIKSINFNKREEVVFTKLSGFNEKSDNFNYQTNFYDKKDVEEKANFSEQANFSNEKKIKSKKVVGERYRYILEFTKCGLYKYLSHIDLIRYFEYLFRISKIDLYLTEGFNPHPKFQFSSALSMGIESNCEILEFYTNSFYEDQFLLNILNEKTNSLIKINRINNVKKVKISLYDQIYFFQYIYFFDKLNYNFINEKIKEIENGFTYIENGEEYNLKEFFKILILKENCFEVEIRKLKSNPSIQLLTKELFGDKIERILKTNMLTFDRRNLYDWVVNYDG